MQRARRTTTPVGSSIGNPVGQDASLSFGEDSRAFDRRGLTDASERAAHDHGALLWDFLDAFIRGRLSFLAVQRLYDRRVLRASRNRKVDRTDLKLPPRELYGLFHLGRLELLRDRRLEPLRRMTARIFGDEGDVGLMDVYCGHIYHEVSILSREHRSVGRFVRRHDPRRYRALFEEVSGYYPERLRRVKRFFSLAMKRLDELLPRWAEERVIIRSVFLFGTELGKRAWGRGREDFYRRMYPDGGEVRGYAVAALSFHESGFTVLAREAYALAKDAAEGIRARRTLTETERRSLDSAVELLGKKKRKAKASGAGAGGAADESNRDDGGDGNANGNANGSGNGNGRDGGS